MTIKIGLHNFFGVELNEVELAPFMIFCGDNGSGKTHLVKILNSIDQFMRNPRSYDLKLSEEISDLLQSRIHTVKDAEKKRFQLTIKENDDVYAPIESFMNKLLNDQKNKILRETFSTQEHILEKISLHFTNKSRIRINISPVEPRIDENDFENESADIEKKSIPVEWRFQFAFSQPNPKIFITSIKFNTLDQLQTDDFIRMISSRLWIYLVRNVYVSNFHTRSGGNYYFPASREAYMRDYNYFLKSEKNNKVIITEYDFDDEEMHNINQHSNDPYIETHITDVIQSLRSTDQYNEDLVNFMEKKFLKIIFQRSQMMPSYILDNEKNISPDLGSSLQNEYIFLRILLGKEKHPNIIIEEPEAHLSIKNSVLLTYLLIALQQKLQSKVWITTHSNFVVDTVNNAIMLSKLDGGTQLAYLKKIGVDEILPTVDKKTTDNISAYFLEDSFATKLKKGAQGIEYEDFTKQIHDFIDITSDLQWEVEKLDEVTGD